MYEFLDKKYLCKIFKKIEEIEVDKIKKNIWARTSI